MRVDNEIYDRKVRTLHEELKSMRQQQAILESNLQASRAANQRLKKENEELRKEIKKTKDKMEEEALDRQRRESQFEFVIRNMEDELTDKVNQYQRLEGKIMPLFETDAVRLKILNQVEYPHRLQIEQKDNIIQNLKEELSDQRRQIEIYKCQVETLKIDQERAIRDLKAKHKNEVNNVMLDLHTLEALEYTRRSSGKMEASLKKDLQYYRNKYFSSDQELTAIRKTLQSTKQTMSDKNNQLTEEILKLREENIDLQEKLRKF